MGIEEYCDNLIRKIVMSIEKKNGKKYFSSIILTGSLGRGEPTYSITSSGVFLKSDVEIGLVVKKSSKKIKQIVKNISEEFNEELNLMILNAKRIKKGQNYNYSIIIPKYKTIFTYDLYNGSKTIFGDDLIGSRKHLVSNIDLYEAKRLVGNRIGELVYLQSQNGQNNAEVYLQWKGKLVLAIGSAWLIISDLYVSSYYEQRIRILENQDIVENKLGVGFVQEYEKAFSFLRKNGGWVEIDDLLLRNFVFGVSTCFDELGLTRSKTNSLSRVLKYIIKYVKSGCDYGMMRIENNILQNLIQGYVAGDEKIKTFAKAWHNILY